MHLKVSVVNQSLFCLPPAEIFHQHKGEVSGCQYELLKIFANAIKFTYELVIPSSGQWGVQQEDGSWNGLVGMLQRQESDITVSDITRDYARSQVVDFTHTYHLDKLIFVMKKAGEATKNVAYFYPFQLHVWVCIIVSLVLCSVLFLIFQDKKNGSLAYRIIRSAEVLTGNCPINSMCTNTPSRIFFALTSLSMVVLSLSYVAVLLSFLMSPVMNFQIETILDLAEANSLKQVKVLIYKDASWESLLIKAKNGTYKDLAVHLKDYPDSYMKFTDSLYNKLMNGYTVMHEEFYIRLYLAESGISDLSDEFFISDEYLQISPIAVMLRKGLRMTAEFDKVIHRLNQARIYQKLQDDNLFRIFLKSQRFAKYNAPKTTLKAITLRDIKFAFILLGFGHLFSLLLLCFEIWHFKQKKN